MACIHRLWVDIGKAQGTAKPVAEQIEADKSRSGAPFERSLDRGRSAPLQEWNELPAEAGSAAVQLLREMNPDAAKHHALPWTNHATKRP
jgi:hypothetical protein